jgi:hypothetical protein
VVLALVALMAAGVTEFPCPAHSEEAVKEEKEHFKAVVNAFLYYR